jgi:transposase
MFNKVRKLKAQGKSNSAIARELKINPKTIAKYLRSNAPPKYKFRDSSTRPDPFEGFETRVKNWLDRTPTLQDQEIFEFLIAEGYIGSERTINRRMKLLRPRPLEERFFEQEYEPGEQSQFDFKEQVELPFVDGMRTIHLHFGTLPHSDTVRVKAYPFRNYECFMDGVHSFFEILGGMTGNIRFDNLAPVVRRVLQGSNRLYTEDFDRAAGYYGFGLLPCAPAKGSDKGDVERDIRTHTIRIKNRVSHESVVFRDFAHLNEWLLAHMLERQSESSQSRLKEEQAKLKRLPPREEGILCKIILGEPSSYGSVRIGKSAYSVPDSMIGVSCRTVVSAYEVKITRIGPAHESEEKEVTHPRKPDGEHSLLLKHILPSMVRKPHAMVRWAHRAILFPSPVCQKFYDRLKELEGYGAEREYLRSINLIHYVPLSEILTGMELVLESQGNKLFDDLKELLLAERRPAQVIDITGALGQSPLKPELSQYDSFIPKQQGA